MLQESHVRLLYLPLPFLSRLPSSSLTSPQAKFPDLSYADLYTYAGVVAVEESNGPAVPFRLGRTDAPDGSTSPPASDPR
jgi:hypothetical protein